MARMYSPFIHASLSGSNTAGLRETSARSKAAIASSLEKMVRSPSIDQPRSER